MGELEASKPRCPPGQERCGASCVFPGSLPQAPQLKAGDTRAQIYFCQAGPGSLAAFLQTPDSGAGRPRSWPVLPSRVPSVP